MPSDRACRHAPKNLPVLNWGCRLTQVELSCDYKMVVAAQINNNKF